jgi:hypothetical protein
MNITEERQAFEAWVQLNGVNAEVRDFNEKQAMFNAWLAATERAEQRAKPVARVSLSSVANWIVYEFCSHGGTFNGIIGKDFTNKAAAIAWAKASGYRVDE